MKRLQFKPRYEGSDCFQGQVQEKGLAQGYILGIAVLENTITILIFLILPQLPNSSQISEFFFMYIFSALLSICSTCFQQEASLYCSVIDPYLIIFKFIHQIFNDHVIYAKLCAGNQGSDNQSERKDLCPLVTDSLMREKNNKTDTFHTSNPFFLLRQFLHLAISFRFSSISVVSRFQSPLLAPALFPIPFLLESSFFLFFSPSTINSLGDFQVSQA